MDSETLGINSFPRSAKLLAKIFMRLEYCKLYRN